MRIPYSRQAAARIAYVYCLNLQSLVSTAVVILFTQIGSPKGVLFPAISGLPEHQSLSAVLHQQKHWPGDVGDSFLPTTSLLAACHGLQNPLPADVSCLLMHASESSGNKLVFNQHVHASVQGHMTLAEDQNIAVGSFQASQVVNQQSKGGLGKEGGGTSWVREVGLLSKTPCCQPAVAVYT